MRKDDDQKKFKEELKKWLKLNRTNRTEFANRCHVSYYTFNNWMSTSSIPLAKVDIIRNLMLEYGQHRADRQAEDKPGMQSFSLLVSQEDYRLFVAAAQQCDLTVEQWAETMLIWDAQNRMNITRESILTEPNPYEDLHKLAEDTADYDKPETTTDSGEIV